MKSAHWFFRTVAGAIPGSAPGSVVEWARDCVKLVGSARSESYDPDITPWTREPVECAADGTRRMTQVAPIQSGKSTAGEIAILYWLRHWHGGDIQYNWQNDLAADARWKEQFERKMKACGPVMARTSADRFAWTKGLVAFPHCNFIMQGVFTDRSVASRPIRGQVNEEIHDEEGWLPGRLEQAHGRTTAFWNSVIFNISNAAKKGSQLHQAFLSGTQQHWQVRCPGCKQFHVMRTRWEDDKPHLGGLRYDMEGCRLENGDVDYGKLAGTVRFQMPCGYPAHDVVTERRALSLSGCYSEPTNPGAPLTERSYTLEAVSVDYIPWIDLIRQKQLAFRARKLGDPTPLQTYLRERECQFVDVRDTATEAKPITLSQDKKKDRAGMPDKKFRFGSLDYQEGKLEDKPHWWCLIVDFNERGDGLVVYEGRLESDGAVIEVLTRHEVQPWCVVADSTYNTEHIYDLCMVNGWTAIRLEGSKTYLHSDGTRHCYAEPEALWPLARRQGPISEDPAREPFYFSVSKWGAFNLLKYHRASELQKFEVPGDVSEAFKRHFAAWSEEEKRVPASNEIEIVWRKRTEKEPDHLYVCASYISVLCEQAGIIGLPEKAAA